MFNEIMNNEYGGVDYKKGHEFIYGNLSYSDNEFTNQSNNLEIYNYLKEKDNPFTSEEIEAFIIGNDIKNKIGNNYMVYDKDEGIQRKMEYGDITILLDRKSTFETYQKIFEYLGVPLTSYKNSNLTLSNELLCFKNIFKLILKYNLKEFDNEFKHAFMSVARSFIFEYDDKYLFDIIQNNDYEEPEKISVIDSFVPSNGTTSTNRIEIFGRSRSCCGRESYIFYQHSS